MNITYVGLNVEEAKKIAQKEGFSVKVYKKEDSTGGYFRHFNKEGFFLPDRIVFVTERDVVVVWTIG